MQGLLQLADIEREEALTDVGVQHSLDFALVEVLEITRQLDRANGQDRVHAVYRVPGKDQRQEEKNPVVGLAPAERYAFRRCRFAPRL